MSQKRCIPDTVKQRHLNTQPYIVSPPINSIARRSFEELLGLEDGYRSVNSGYTDMTEIYYNLNSKEYRMILSNINTHPYRVEDDGR